MLHSIVRLTPFAAVLLAFAPLNAGAARPKPVKHLWATVNVCDTPRSPDKLGVRARMPGDGTKERMYMRFTAQLKSGKRWNDNSGRSGWVHVGSAQFLYQEQGYTFDFRGKLKKGQRFRARGLVQFQWRARRGKGNTARWVVVRREHRFTAGGHPTKYSQPRNYSQDTCLLRGPSS
jgi:hypothetical protein